MDAPLRPAGRIASLDILRGLALLGMFVVHFHERSTDPGGIDDLGADLLFSRLRRIWKSHGPFASCSSALALPVCCPAKPEQRPQAICQALRGPADDAGRALQYRARLLGNQRAAGVGRETMPCS